MASSSSITVNIPGIESHDAERRRQIALRALSERLSKVEQVSWPSTADDSKHSDKSKNVSITMPQILAHHQSSTLAPNISSAKISPSIGTEAEKLIVGPGNNQSSSI